MLVKQMMQSTKCQPGRPPKRAVSDGWKDVESWDDSYQHLDLTWTDDH